NVIEGRFLPADRTFDTAWTGQAALPMLHRLPRGRAGMKQFGIGQPIRRVEDRRFLTGYGRYLDDISHSHQAHAVVLRSPHAHARIRALDISAAAALSGVLAVLTGEDLAKDGLGTIPCATGLTNRDGSPIAMPPRPALVQERVRHVGDAVALVVAESAALARDAADQIVVDYDPLPAIADTAEALDPGQPAVWPELNRQPGNLCFEWEVGDGDAVLRSTGLSVEIVANMGAYLSNFAPEIPTFSGAVMHSGVYAIPAIHVVSKGVFTNTVPVDAYRGAGRPEAAYALERLIDVAARRLGVTPDELRRRNFIRPTAMPHTTPLGLVYDCGDFGCNMQDELVAADAAGFSARR